MYKNVNHNVMQQQKVNALAVIINIAIVYSSQHAVFMQLQPLVLVLQLECVVHSL